MEKFVHLHLHTQYSLLDGATIIEKMADILAQRGAPAVAMTDHGNMYATVKFAKACQKKGIKPIIGTEFYVSPDLTVKSGKPHIAHLILLAKNQQGYQNLMKLNSIAWLKGFYYKPRIDYDTLQKYSEGLICCSACLAGDIPRLLLEHRFEDAEKLGIRLREMFAPGDFYIEVQDHGIPEQKEILPQLFELAEKIGVKTVATNDVHYLTQNDAEMQDVLLCIQTGKTIDDPVRMRMHGNQFYLKTEAEMRELFKSHPEAIDNTMEVAEKCSIELDFKSHFYPKYTEAPAGMSNLEYLRQITFEGLAKKYPVITEEIKNRAEFELSVIHGSGFLDYYLVVWDFLMYAKKVGVPVGPGRGSGAASIVAYAIGITNVDPLRFALYFERFLNPERIGPPDFDIDFCPVRRGEVIDYVTQKYGEDNVCQIITFGTLAPKAAIKDVGRVLKMSYHEVDKITKLFPAPQKMPKSPAIVKLFGLDTKPENQMYVIPELKNMYDTDPLVQKIVDIASQLENMPRNTSIHAAGVIICCDSVDMHSPLAKNGDMVTTQYDKKEVEALGLLKMDFLGLITLTDLDLMIRTVKKTRGIEIDLDTIDYDDQKVYQMISSGDTDGVFQIESGGMRKLTMDMQPVNLEDLIVIGAIYRPGPMDEIPTYLKNRKNPESIEYDDERMKEELSVTYGVMIYQEQVMMLCRKLAGYTMGQADHVRKIMGKKLKDELVEERDRFIHGWVDPEGKKSIAGAVKMGMKEEIASKLWSKMEKFGSYAFNKAHAAAYAYVLYQTAYFKYYYLTEFYSSIINNRITKSDEIRRYMEYAKQHNIEILPPNVNKSMAYFSVEDKNIRYGLGGIKNVGVGLVEELVKERNANGEFKDLQDFISRMGNQAHNKRFLESMILAGAFDCFGKYRSQMMVTYEAIVERVSSDRKFQNKGQISLFDNMLKNDTALNTIVYPDLQEYDEQQKLKFEKTVLGVYMSGHILDKFRDKYQIFNLTSAMLEGVEIEGENGDSTTIYDNIEDGKEVKCGGIITEVRKLNTKSGNKEMAVFCIEDIYGTFEVIAFPKVYEKHKEHIAVDNMITVIGKVNIREGERPIVALENIINWQEEESEQIIQPQVENKPEKLEKFCLKFNLLDKTLQSIVMEILQRYPGKLPVLIKCTAQNKYFATKICVDGSTALKNELYAYLSPENIVIA